ncbi:GNAT family N-acetyltransferase [Belnapia rosea]|uniref:Protein N-acetyltransferase, RimJ/RimL family n=1 Tax=Belnapia rosea TaxID=938405 RepID=A0A1G6KFC7_9PROT|nr:GNAT family protein [Belnapia rosea]SDB18535.1 Protein N-acetyltransferase, RimJ/RimL family [Belnapia rosea]SDC29720.1 Protein N-acetyltransferase, RimJ/RimL family [Belnapia rosea]
MSASPPRRLGPADAAAYRVLRLEALRLHPEAFAADWAEEAARPLDWFAERLETSQVWAAAGPNAALLGMVGLMRPATAKLRHKAVIWGFYVQSGARGSGLGTALLTAALTTARGTAEEVRLTVTAGNEAALRLYERFGFHAYGREERALRVAGHDHDEVLMALSLG